MQTGTCNLLVNLAARCLLFWIARFYAYLRVQSRALAVVVAGDWADLGLACFMHHVVIPGQNSNQKFILAIFMSFTCGFHGWKRLQMASYPEKITFIAAFDDISLQWMG